MLPYTWAIYSRQNLNSGGGEVRHKFFKKTVVFFRFVLRKLHPWILWEAKIVWHPLEIQIEGQKLKPMDVPCFIMMRRLVKVET